MPIESCRKDNKPGLRWGTHGACFTYTAGDAGSRGRARQQALRQSRAIRASQAREKRRGQQVNERLMGR